jgi:predicted acyl esterase
MGERTVAKRHTVLRTTTTGAVSAALLAGTALGFAPTAAATDGAAGIRFVDIAGDGGTVLKANVVTPAGSDGTRRYPVIVLPTSWSMPQIEYLAQARKLADAGYVVVGYNSRGFWESGGNIEVAGPPDVADASKVIDWALANTPPTPSGSAWRASATARASASSPPRTTSGSRPSSR